MGELGKWLLHDEQKELFEIVTAIALNVLFLAMIALLLWPLGRVMLALRLAKGYGILWIVTSLTILLINRIHRFFGIDLYTRVNAYVLSCLAASCFLQVGWSAFAVLTVQSFVSHASIWIVVFLYFVGTLSCLIAFFAVSSFYQGHVYKMASLPLAGASFIVFSLWPASGRLIYGWFFDFF